MSNTGNRFRRLFGWDSPKIVVTVHGISEWLETVSLVAAIALDILGVTAPANICWAVLAMSDALRHMYGLRDKYFGDKELAEMRERATVAEQRSAELQSDVEVARERQTQLEHVMVLMRLGTVPRDRIFDTRKFQGLLWESNTKGTAEVLYQPGDGEASTLATEIHSGLIVGGWTVQPPTPIPSTQDNIAPILALGARPEGVTILARTISAARDNPICSAFEAIPSIMLFSWDQDPELPEGVLRVVVGPKP